MSKKEELSIWLRLKDGVSKAFGDISVNFEKNIDALKESTLIFAGAFAGLVAGVFGSVKAFADAQAIAAQTEKVLQSTGYAAGMTADEVNKLAIALQNKTGVDDDVIQSGENMLLTFTQISKEAFPDATKAALDMTAAMNGGQITQEALKGTAIQLGKALNDPTVGMTALRRVGVTFTEQQQEQIKALQASGDLLGAQTMILKELQKEFGGSSEKLSVMQGAYLMAKTQAGNFMELLGEQLAPIMTKLAGWISETAVNLGDFIKAHKELIVPVGAAVLAFTGLIAGLTGIIAIAPMIAAAWVVITGPIGITVAAISGLTAATVYFATSQTKLAENVRAVWTGIQGVFTGNIDKMKAAYKDLSESKATHDAKMTDDTAKRAAAEAAAMQKSVDAAKAAAEQKLADEQTAIEAKAEQDAAAKEAEVEKEISDGQAALAQDQNFMAQRAELEKIAEEARKAFETQKKQFDQLSAADRLKLLMDTLGKEKVLKTTEEIDELVSKGKHEEAKKLMDELYATAYTELNKNLIKDLDTKWKQHWDYQVATAILGRELSSKEYSALGDFFKNIMTLMGKESLAAFRIMQGVAIVNALVATYEGATKAFAAMAGIPPAPVWGFVAAGAATAAGLANVDEIRRQEPPQAETGAYVARGGLAELHDQEMVLNKQQTAALAAGAGVQHIYLQLDGETLQKWVAAADNESARMERMGVR